MNRVIKKYHYLLVPLTIIIVIAIGIILRFIAMTKGHNFDFESYKIVGEIVSSGGNVYAETSRYNYGPVWFAILGTLYSVTIHLLHSELLFRISIVLLLTVADIGIAILLRKRFGIVAFTLFFLNPISIMITGFHNQFDNLAIVIGMMGVFMMPEVGMKKLTKQHVVALSLIGLSLMVKHILFIFPLWLFIREAYPRVKIAMLGIPIGIFLAGFLPFVFTSGLKGIIHNVFLYKSLANAPLLSGVFSPSIVLHLNPFFFMIGILLIIGFISRKLPLIMAFFWYLITIVCVSPAIANQYLVIPMVAIAALPWVFFLPYIIITSMFIIYYSLCNPSITWMVCRISSIGELGDIQKGYNIIVILLTGAAIFSSLYLYKRKVLYTFGMIVKQTITEQITPFRR